MHSAAPDFLAILDILCANEVEFVVVGALSAVLQGAPIMTFDLDIVHNRSAKNLERLKGALDELDAHYRGHDKRLVPSDAHLSSPGHQLLMTKHGPLDLLGAIEEGLTYDSLLSHSIVIDVDDISIRLLTLDKYVDLKERSSVDKDRARLPTLRQTLEDRDGGSE